MSSKDAVRKGVRTLRWKRRIAAALAGVAVLAICFAVRWISGSKPAAAANPAPAPASAQRKSRKSWQPSISNTSAGKSWLKNVSIITAKTFWKR